MRIEIADTDRNWLNWGALVKAWIRETQVRPRNVKELKTQLVRHQVFAIVDGDDERAVAFSMYPDDPNSPLTIVLPTPAMCDAISVGAGRYNLPLFYDIAYEKPVRANLSQQEAENFAQRRVGEYTINECC